jgi:hypothetical protein
MCRTQYRTVSTDGNDQVNIKQMLPIQIRPIHAGELNIMMIQYSHQIGDTLLMSLIP